MGEAKKILVKPIKASDANRLCKLWHYSGKVVPNSQLHFGVFYEGHCEGVMQFGPSMDKRRMAKNLGIGFNEFLELNRMAFSEKLPKNSESRAIGVALRLIGKKYPHIKLILSFSDGTQCGDGTIYRASGFKLLDIKKNSSQVLLSDQALKYVKKFIPNAGSIIAKKSLDNVMDGSKYLSSTVKRYGYEPMSGFQLKYVFCIDRDLMKNYQFLPFDKIKEMGASMYKGVRIEHESNAKSNQDLEGGAVPTYALQSRLESQKESSEN